MNRPICVSVALAILSGSLTASAASSSAESEVRASAASGEKRYPIEFMIAESESRPRPEPKPRPEPPRKHWYGGQIMLSDAAALVLVVTTLQISNHELQIASAIATGTTYFGASPIVHALHGNFGRGAGAIGIRLGGLLVYGATFVFPGRTTGIGLAFTVLPAMVVDAAALAWEDVKVDSTTEAGRDASLRQSRMRWIVTPIVSSHEVGAGLRLAM